MAGEAGTRFCGIDRVERSIVWCDVCVIVCGVSECRVSVCETVSHAVVCDLLRRLYELSRYLFYLLSFHE